MPAPAPASRRLGMEIEAAEARPLPRCALVAPSHALSSLLQSLASTRLARFLRAARLIMRRRARRIISRVLMSEIDNICQRLATLSSLILSFSLSLFFYLSPPPLSSRRDHIRSLVLDLNLCMYSYVCMYSAGRTAGLRRGALPCAVCALLPASTWAEAKVLLCDCTREVVLLLL